MSASAAAAWLEGRGGRALTVARPTSLEDQHMAVIRNASAHWEGSLMEGAGKVTFESSELGSHDVTWAARAERVERPDQPRGAHRGSALDVLLDGPVARTRPGRHPARDDRHQGGRHLRARHRHHRRRAHGDRRRCRASPPSSSSRPPRPPRRVAPSARRSRCRSRSRSASPSDLKAPTPSHTARRRRPSGERRRRAVGAGVGQGWAGGPARVRTRRSS